MTNNIEYICEGCTKVSSEFGCTVYSKGVPAFYIRRCACPFNPPKVVLSAKDKQKVRVGQQKTKRAKG